MTNPGNLGGCTLWAVSEVLHTLTHTHERVNYGSGTGWKMQVSVSGLRQQTKLSTSETVMQMIYVSWKGVWEPHLLNKGGKPVPWGIRRMMKADFVWQRALFLQNWIVKQPLGTQPRCRKVLVCCGMDTLITGQSVLTIHWTSPGSGPEEWDMTWPSLSSRS